MHARHGLSRSNYLRVAHRAVLSSLQACVGIGCTSWVRPRPLGTTQTYFLKYFPLSCTLKLSKTLMETVLSWKPFWKLSIWIDEDGAKKTVTYICHFYQRFRAFYCGWCAKKYKKVWIFQWKRISVKTWKQNANASEVENILHRFR